MGFLNDSNINMTYFLIVFYELTTINRERSDVYILRLYILSFEIIIKYYDCNSLKCTALLSVVEQRLYWIKKHGIIIERDVWKFVL
jgi:hypothetical protein